MRLAITRPATMPAILRALVVRAGQGLPGRAAAWKAKARRKVTAPKRAVVAIKKSVVSSMGLLGGGSFAGGELGFGYVGYGEGDALQSLQVSGDGDDSLFPA